MSEKIKVLFVCLGNICRSPLAEILFAHQVKALGKASFFEIDSCGTGNWHQGELADYRMRETAKKNNLEIIHRARQIVQEDFEKFDYLLVMDYQNLLDVKSLNAEYSHKVALITDYSRDYTSQIIHDPYFGDIQEFESVFNLLFKVTSQVADSILLQYQTKS